MHHVTVSYNYVYNYQKVAFNGYSDSDTKNLAAGTTYHHNRFENVESRFPSQRRGLSHIYNNYFNNVFISGINVRMGGVAKIESNYFENIKNPVNSRDSSEIGYWDLINNYIGQRHHLDHAGRQQALRQCHQLGELQGVPGAAGLHVHRHPGGAGQGQGDCHRGCGEDLAE